LIFIDYQDRRPIYEQIIERFEKLILTGALEADSQMPSVRQLASDLSINPNTIQKAYAALEQEGYIYPVKGKGNFVNGNLSLHQKKKEDCLQRLQELLNECREYGVTAEESLKMIEHVYGKA
jgi:GntR family transcriptional regulator